MDNSRALFSWRFAELRSFAAKNSPTVESTVKQSSLARARGTVASQVLARSARSFVCRGVSALLHECKNTCRVVPIPLPSLRLLNV
ncbi:MAG: hypothetical protein DMF38_07370 [Verrucomicrobia bacterium]|nr:MAG: hypothetical protein DMF38_07370 [Verrucomicrobiota bacterium]